MNMRTLISKTLVFLLLGTVLPTALRAQGKSKILGSVTLSGYIRDRSAGETLPGASVRVKGTNVTVTTNAYGFYSLTLAPGNYTFEFRYIGYQPAERTVGLEGNLSLDMHLKPAATTMKEVVISGEKTNQNLQKTQMGVQTVSMRSVRQLPALMGEADVVRTIQLLPGVSTVGEGAPGFNVRGGGIDQNLILLDEAPVYNGSHLLGFFSVFNPDAVRDVALMKSEMPARFGGRLSSLLDVRMKEGNARDLAFVGGIGTVSSRFMAEGPIVKDKSSFILAGRRSYADLFLALSGDSALKDTRVYFYDLTGKLNFRLSKKDRLFLSTYAGRDVNKAGEEMNMDWGNRTTTARWNHLYSSRLFSNLAAIYSDYTYMLGASGEDATSFEWKAHIRDYTLKNTWNWYMNPSNTIYFGGEITRHDFSPGTARPTGSGSAFNEQYMPEQRAFDYAAFWDHEVQLNDRVSFQYGVRYSLFRNVSPGESTVYGYAGPEGQRKQPVNPRTFGRGETIRWYHSLEPRATVKIQTSGNSAVKASYTRTSQNLHYVSNTMAASPLDIYIPSSANVRPELADQVSAGYFYAAPENAWEASAEVYYRDLKNQIDFISGAEILLNRNLEGDMLFGTGRAYGSEIFLKRNAGKLNGWLSYTLSRTEKRIAGLNNDRYFPAKYDRTHALSLAGIYEWRPRTLLSATFSFSTGTPATLPDSRFDFDGFPVQYNSSNGRNGFRQPSYQRLDLSATFRGRTVPGRKYHSEFVVSVYNALGRRNPYSIYFRQNEDARLRTEAVRYSVIGTVVPSVTWNFSF